MMTDDLHARIAAVQHSHIFCIMECSCGKQFERRPKNHWRVSWDDWKTYAEWEWAQHVADAVILELDSHGWLIDPESGDRNAR